LLINTLSGCVDNRKDIAMAVLFPDMTVMDRKDDLAMTGALLGRFPPGSPASAVQDFVTSLGGKCDVGSHYTSSKYYDIACSIIEHEGIGFENLLRIEVQTENSAIKKIRAQSSGVGLST
jgi:hypothetical protein